MQEEKHFALASHINTTTDEVISLAAVNKKKFYNNNTNTASQSQNITYRPPHYGTNDINTRKSNLFCNYCKKQGHTKENCYRLHGFPTNSTRDNWNNKKVAAMVQADNSNNNQTASPTLTVDQYNQLLSLLGQHDTQSIPTTEANNDDNTCLLAGKSCFLSVTNSTWIIDSGATNHMCCDLSLFKSYTTVSDNIDNTITIPNGNLIKIAHKGTVILSPELTLSNVLHVPAFNFNLISVTKLCSDMHCSLTFLNNCCSVQGPSLRRPILLGKLVQGLYHLVDTFPESNQQPQKDSSASI